MSGSTKQNIATLAIKNRLTESDIQIMVQICSTIESSTILNKINFIKLIFALKKSNQININYYYKDGHKLLLIKSVPKRAWSINLSKLFEQINAIPTTIEFCKLMRDEILKNPSIGGILVYDNFLKFIEEQKIEI